MPKPITFKIDRGVKPPEINVAANTIRSMRVGDSVFFTDRSDANRFAQCMYQMSRDKTWAQHMRKVEGGWRVWKVKR